MSKWKTALVLFLIGAISGTLIFLTNAGTEDGIALIRAEREERIYRAMFNLEDDVILGMEVESLDGVLQERITLEVDGVAIGVVYKGTDNNSYGEITVLVGIHPDATIAQVAIGATTNTPIFVNIIETDYLDPFIGMDVSEVTFDAKTGASYTYGSVEDIVRAATADYDEERGGME